MMMMISSIEEDLGQDVKGGHIEEWPSWDYKEDAYPEEDGFVWWRGEEGCHKEVGK